MARVELDERPLVPAGGATSARRNTGRLDQCLVSRIDYLVELENSRHRSPVVAATMRVHRKAVSIRRLEESTGPLRLS